MLAGHESERRGRNDWRLKKDQEAFDLDLTAAGGLNRNTIFNHLKISISHISP